MPSSLASQVLRSIQYTRNFCCDLQCDFPTLRDVNKWIINKSVSACFLTWTYFTHSHPSKGENCTRNHSGNCKCKQAVSNFALYMIMWNIFRYSRAYLLAVILCCWWARLQCTPAWSTMIASPNHLTFLAVLGILGVITRKFFFLWLLMWGPSTQAIFFFWRMWTSGPHLNIHGWFTRSHPSNPSEIKFHLIFSAVSMKRLLCWCRAIRITIVGYLITLELTRYVLNTSCFPYFSNKF